MIVFAARAPLCGALEAHGTQATESKEGALARALMEELERAYRPVGDSEVAKYVDEIGRKLRDTPVHVRVLRTREVWAKPVGAGYVALTSGLMLRARTEAEIAAVIAHELAHPTGGWTGVCLRFPSQDGGLPLGELESMKKTEVQADARAREDLKASGYDPDVLNSVFTDLRRPSLNPRAAEPSLERVQARLRALH